MSELRHPVINLSVVDTRSISIVYVRIAFGDTTSFIVNPRFSGWLQFNVTEFLVVVFDIFLAGVSLPIVISSGFVAIAITVPLETSV